MSDGVKPPWTRRRTVVTWTIVAVAFVVLLFVPLGGQGSCYDSSDPAKSYCETHTLTIFGGLTGIRPY